MEASPQTQLPDTTSDDAVASEDAGNGAPSEEAERRSSRLAEHILSWAPLSLDSVDVRIKNLADDPKWEPRASPIYDPSENEPKLLKEHPVLKLAGRGTRDVAVLGVQIFAVLIAGQTFLSAYLPESRFNTVGAALVAGGLGLFVLPKVYATSARRSLALLVPSVGDRVTLLLEANADVTLHKRTSIAYLLALVACVAGASAYDNGLTTRCIIGRAEKKVPMAVAREAGLLRYTHQERGEKGDGLCQISIVFDSHVLRPPEDWDCFEVPPNPQSSYIVPSLGLAGLPRAKVDSASADYWGMVDDVEQRFEARSPIRLGKSAPPLTLIIELPGDGVGCNAETIDRYDVHYGLVYETRCAPPPGRVLFTAGGAAQLNQ